VCQKDIYNKPYCRESVRFFVICDSFQAAFVWRGVELAILCII